MSAVLESAEGDAIKAADAAALLGMRSPRGPQRAAALGHIPRGVWWRVGRDLYFSRSRLIAWRNSGGTAAPNDMQDESAAA